MPRENRFKGMPKYNRLLGMPRENRLEGMPRESRLLGMPRENCSNIYVFILRFYVRGILTSVKNSKNVFTDLMPFRRLSSTLDTHINLMK